MIGTVALFFIFIVLLFLWKSKRPHNFPPGPPPIPFWGNFFQLPTGLLSPVIDEWSKKYGPIIGFTYFNQFMVFITGVDTILAALHKEEFKSRPDNFFIRDRSFGKSLGIFFSTGEQWASSRKFVVKHLRVFSKYEKEAVMSDEIALLMEKIEDGSTIQGKGYFALSALNVIWMILANRRFDINDKKSLKFFENLSGFFRKGSPSGAYLPNIFPSVRFIHPDVKFSRRVIREIQDYIKAVVQEHKEVLDPKNPIDLIDHYLVELEQNKKNTSPYFSEEDLITICFDMFGAGAESTSNTVEFVLMYLTLYPEVQEKLHEELDRVLGRSRKPELNDKTELHYTMAVLNEVERINSIAPTSVMYNCTQNTNFEGYFIPKDTIISMDFWAFGHDIKYWEKPNEFKPERFLNNDGKYIKSPILHTFGLGQRKCVGEVLAQNTIFLFTTTFLEKYSISLPPGEPKPSTEALPGFTTSPKAFKIIIKSRY